MSKKENNYDYDEEYKVVVKNIGKCDGCDNPFQVKKIKGEWKPYDRIWYGHFRQHLCEKCGKCADCDSAFPIEENRGKWKVFDRYWYGKHREYLCGSCHSMQQRSD